MSANCYSFQELSDFVDLLTTASRTVIAQYFRRPFNIDAKADESPVTIADRETERSLRQLINGRFPDHGIFGEEFGEENVDNKHVWVLDPIDGTRSFITGTPTFGTLISLLENGHPVLGVIDMPAMNERWISDGKQGTSVNGSVCRVSQREQLDGCRLVSTSPEMFTVDQLMRFKQLLEKTSFYRYGGDCYNYALLASGHIDLVVESDLQLYDFSALVPVVEGAGGVITDWQGQALTMQSKGDVVAAASKTLHSQAIEFLKTAQQ